MRREDLQAAFGKPPRSFDERVERTLRGLDEPLTPRVTWPVMTTRGTESM